jgi:hypothetical protein
MLLMLSRPLWLLTGLLAVPVVICADIMLWISVGEVATGRFP